MKHIDTYQAFLNESNGYFGPGDTVLILFKIEGTDKREIVPVQIKKGIKKNAKLKGEPQMIPVKIVKKERNNSYLVSFNVENNPLPNHQDMVIDANKIIGAFQQIKAPISPALQSNQPVTTDYSKAGYIGSGGVSNDYVLPNS